LTDRTGRPTDKAFGGVSATFAQTGFDNSMPKGDLAPWEWCHLIGDGDGGSNSASNLNIGTNAVNTEQLLLELVQRTQGLRDQLKANGMAVQIAASGILAPIPIDEHVPWQQLHMGNWFRYDIKILPKGKPPITVVTDVMDAQRSNITKNTVRFMMSQAKDLIVERLGGLGVNTSVVETFGEPKTKKKAMDVVPSSSSSWSAPQSSVGQLGASHHISFLQATDQLNPGNVGKMLSHGYAPHAVSHSLEASGMPFAEASSMVSQGQATLPPQTEEQMIHYHLNEAYEDAMASFEGLVKCYRPDKRQGVVEWACKSFLDDVDKFPETLTQHPSFHQLFQQAYAELQQQMQVTINSLG
jgi:hypothetical protein